MERFGLFGCDEGSTALGIRAARRNVVIMGIYDPDHHKALVSSLKLGCSAFPDPVELVNSVSILYCALPERPAWLSQLNPQTVVLTSHAWAGALPLGVESESETFLASSVEHRGRALEFLPSLGL